MKEKRFFVALISLLFLASCYQNEDLLENNLEIEANYDISIGNIVCQSIKSVNNKLTLDTLKFTYRGKTYVSDCIFGDEILIKDESIKYFFEKLNNIPNVAIEIKSDSSIEFYDSKEELDCANQLRNQYPFTRAEFAPDGSYVRNFELRLWEHAKGRKKGGRYTHFYSNGIQGNQSPTPVGYNEVYMTKIGFNNNISSCQMWGEVHMTNLIACQTGQFKRVSVTFYDGNFTGKNLTFNDVTVTKTYSERDYFSGFNFNDLTSSFTISYY